MESTSGVAFLAFVTGFHVNVSRGRRRLWLSDDDHAAGIAGETGELCPAPRVLSVITRFLWCSITLALFSAQGRNSSSTTHETWLQPIGMTSEMPGVVMVSLSMRRCLCLAGINAVRSGFLSTALHRKGQRST